MDVCIEEFLKSKNYERSRKRFQVEREANNYDLQRFMMFLQKRRKFQQNSKLSFEVNLDDDDEAKFAVKIADIITKCRVKRKVTKEEVPKAFISHVISLGFQSCYAEALYENKDDWMGLNTGKLEYDND